MDSFLNALNTAINYFTSSGGDSTPQTPSRYHPYRQEDEPDTIMGLSYADICVARAMLKSLGLPTELALEVLNYAQYEPVLEFASGGRVMAEAVMGSATSARVCLPAEVLSANTIRHLSGPNVTMKVKEIEFAIKSKDQGWTSEDSRDTYNTSSWLEVSIFRPGPLFSTLDSLSVWDREFHTPQDLQDYLLRRGHKLVDERPVSAAVGPQGGEPPIAWYLQGNKVTERQQIDYRVVWTPDSSEGNEGAGNGENFINVLKDGDSVLVWARAKVGFGDSDIPTVAARLYADRRQYPGWRCEVDNISMVVRYGFDELS